MNEMEITLKGALQVGLGNREGTEVYVSGMDLGDILKTALPDPMGRRPRAQIEVRVTIEGDA